MINTMRLCVVVAEWSKAQVSGQWDASDPGSFPDQDIFEFNLINMSTGRIAYKTCRPVAGQIATACLNTKNDFRNGFVFALGEREYRTNPLRRSGPYWNRDDVQSAPWRARSRCSMPPPTAGFHFRGTQRRLPASNASANIFRLPSRRVASDRQAAATAPTLKRPATSGCRSMKIKKEKFQLICKLLNENKSW